MDVVAIDLHRSGHTLITLPCGCRVLVTVQTIPAELSDAMVRELLAALGVQFSAAGAAAAACGRPH